MLSGIGARFPCNVRVEGGGQKQCSPAQHYIPPRIAAVSRVSLWKQLPGTRHVQLPRRCGAATIEHDYDYAHQERARHKGKYAKTEWESEEAAGQAPYGTGKPVANARSNRPKIVEPIRVIGKEAPGY
jgi:hypothetical protein